MINEAYINLFEEVYKVAHDEHLQYYIQACNEANKEPKQEIINFYDTLPF